VIPFGGTYSFRYVDAVAGYASYKATDKLTLNGRAEYANGPGLTGLLLANDGEAPGPGGSGGAFNKVVALTGTLQYDLWGQRHQRLEIVGTTPPMRQLHSEAPSPEPAPRRTKS